QLLDQLLQRDAAGTHREAADHVHAVTGHVIAVYAGERGAHRRPISGPGVTQQGRDDNRVVPGMVRTRFAHRNLQARWTISLIVNNIDYLGTAISAGKSMRCDEVRSRRLERRTGSSERVSRDRERSEQGR